MAGTSGDNGASINLDAHTFGTDDAARNLSGGISIGHTWLIPIGALVLIWVLGYVFRNVRV